MYESDAMDSASPENGGWRTWHVQLSEMRVLLSGILM